MVDSKIIEWLLKGDPSIRYQTNRDLLDLDKDIKDIFNRRFLN